MPTQETLERFIAAIESNKHDEAVEKFYTENSTMQENQMPVRIGKKLHVASERKVLARAKSVTSYCIRPVFANGDHVVLHYKFRFDWLDGTVTEMEELALQRWEGELIAEERFFYDPAQRVPKSL